jgi:deoxyribodipyrimidine photo-lyase
MRAIHWFRNDLRLQDNTALAAAAQADQLAMVFVIDPKLMQGPSAGAPRVRFLHGCLDRLKADVEKRGQRLILRRGDPLVEMPRLLRECRLDLLTFNRDYSPYARRRDEKVRRAALEAGVRVKDFKDRVVFEAEEIRSQKGEPYRVYTPFRKAWLRRWRTEGPPGMSRLKLPSPIPGVRSEPLSAAAPARLLQDVTEIPVPAEAAASRRLERFLDGQIAAYHVNRDYPAVDGTSRLSPYLRFGAISIRTCFLSAMEAAREKGSRKGAGVWIDELVWREFYSAILMENPHVLKRSFRPEYEKVRWNHDPKAFKAWSEGRTGYPFVDAAMRQLRRTGWMHNRARMVVASFLTKDLLLDWRRGERLFMHRLVDGDPASNNGGWQWAASTGTDAQPYFRVFNPVLQGERFDPEGKYVKQSVPELGALPPKLVHRPWKFHSPPASYPRPIVDHGERRLEAIERFREAKAR